MKNRFKWIATLPILSALGGCKTFHAWLVDDSRFLDMLYQGSIWFIVAIGIFIFLMFTFRQDFKLSIKAAATFIVIGLVVGFWKTSKGCTFDELQAGDCPAYRQAYPLDTSDLNKD